MRALITLTMAESKLLRRDWGLLGFGLAFPPFLLFVMGAFLPDFQEASAELGGLRPIDVYTPVVLMLVFAMVGITSIPSYLATYRHTGVLRRMRTTPVGPVRLLSAQLLSHLLLILMAGALTVAVAILAFDVSLEGSWPWFAVSSILAATAMFSIGLVVGAVAPSPSSAPAAGTFIWMTMMFFAGLWYPREVMVAPLRRISDLSPSGAAVDAMNQAWFGGAPSAETVAVLVGWTVVIGAVAARTFRWE